MLPVYTQHVRTTSVHQCAAHTQQTTCGIKATGETGSIIQATVRDTSLHNNESGTCALAIGTSLVPLTAR